MVASFFLTCAVLASLAVGVLVAYGLCLGLFQLFRMHAEAESERRQLAGAAVTQIQA